MVAVGETWLHDGCLDNELLAADLNTIFRKDRGGNKRGGGVLLKVKAVIIIRRPDLKQQLQNNSLSLLLATKLLLINGSLQTFAFEFAEIQPIKFALLAITICSTSTGNILMTQATSCMELSLQSDQLNNKLFSSLQESHDKTCQTTLDLGFYDYPEEIINVSIHEDFNSDHFVVSFSLFLGVAVSLLRQCICRQRH